jgi:hypothetical protein
MNIIDGARVWRGIAVAAAAAAPSMQGSTAQHPAKHHLCHMHMHVQALFDGAVRVCHFVRLLQLLSMAGSRRVSTMIQMCRSGVSMASCAGN